MLIYVSVAQGIVEEAFVHLLIDIYRAFDRTEAYFPWIYSYLFLGRQSQYLILSRSNPYKIAGYYDQCYLVQGYRGISNESALYSPVSR